MEKELKVSEFNKETFGGRLISEIEEMICLFHFKRSRNESEDNLGHLRFKIITMFKGLGIDMNYTQDILVIQFSRSIKNDVIVVTF